jgi:hypothetical protein
MQFTRKTGWIAPALLLAAAAALPAGAAEPDKYLPSDSEAVLVINVSQLLDSPLMKKYGLEQLKEQLKSNNDAASFFKAAGLDPLKDIHHVTVGASLAGGKPKYLIVVHGKFNLDKVNDALSAEAKAKPEEVKVIDKGNQRIYEVTPKDSKDKPHYAAFANAETLIVSPSLEQTTNGLKKAEGKVSATLTTALTKLGGTESVYGAAVITDEMKKGLENNPQMSEIAPKLQYFTGIFNLTNDFNLKLSVQTSDAKAADKIKAMISQMMPILGAMAAGQQEQFGSAITDMVKKIEVKKDDKNAVTISLTVSEEMMKDLKSSADKKQ